MLQVENARALGRSWPCTHGSRPRPDQTPSPGPPQMPAGKPASQAEEPDDLAAAPTEVPAVAGRTPARASPIWHLPFHPACQRALGHSLREPRARHDNYVALLAMNQTAGRPSCRRSAHHRQPCVQPSSTATGRPADAAKSQVARRRRTPLPHECPSTQIMLICAARAESVNLSGPAHISDGYVCAHCRAIAPYAALVQPHQPG